MCAASTRADQAGGEAGPTRLIGRVERRLLAQGTKSEHQGLVLVTPDGALWRLRRIGANPFQDAVLDALAGQQVQLDGPANDDDLFFIERWSVLAP